MHHRGPDAAGELVTEAAGASICLGHRRLSIIGLATGDQPIANETGDIQIVVNGEIYNFRALRQRLEAQGHRFATGSDSETLVHLYEQHGLAMLDDVAGMFAFALWDGQRGRLILGRDRLGQKPLYYRESDGRVSFASELGALLQDVQNPTIDARAMRLYLSLQYVPAPATIVSGVSQLPPAHLAIFDGGPARLIRYWSLQENHGPPVTHGDLRAAFDEAVACRLMSEVPLGAFLSGGIDSTLVVASMARSQPQAVQTFSIGFEESQFDERPYAELVARRYGCTHHQRVVRPDAAAVLPLLVRHYGEPFADSSAIPTWYLSEMTGERVTVALSGDAGDELFAGYRRYLAGRLAGLYDRMPGSGLADWLARSWDRIGGPARHLRTRRRQLKRFLDHLDRPPLERYASWISIFDREQLDQLMRPELRGPTWETTEYLEGLLSNNELSQRFRRDPVSMLCRLDLLSYLPGDLLVKVDRASMAHSLEVRSPFLDHRLVELADRLPGARRMGRWQLKRLLKNLFADRIPLAIRRRPKVGFGVPISRWLRSDLSEMTRDLLLNGESRVKQYASPGVVDHLVETHLVGAEDHGYRLWALLVLEQWCREFLG